MTTDFTYHIAVITIILCMIGVNFCSIISSIFAWSRFLITIHKWTFQPKIWILIFWTVRIMISEHFLNILHLIFLVYLTYFHQRWKAVNSKIPWIHDFSDFAQKLNFIWFIKCLKSKPKWRFGVYFSDLLFAR